MQFIREFVSDPSGSLSAALTTEVGLGVQQSAAFLRALGGQLSWLASGAVTELLSGACLRKLVDRVDADRLAAVAGLDLEAGRRAFVLIGPLIAEGLRTRATDVDVFATLLQSEGAFG